MKILKSLFIAYACINLASCQNDKLNVNQFKWMEGRWFSKNETQMNDLMEWTIEKDTMRGKISLFARGEINEIGCIVIYIAKDTPYLKLTLKELKKEYSITYKSINYTKDLAKFTPMVAKEENFNDLKFEKKGRDSLYMSQMDNNKTVNVIKFGLLVQ
ncbi:MAG: hypothetical protein SGJ04_07620 [Bacteroidota bacterium]|nr:hypothetical protein [Bacteroidota bacterium]